MTVNLKFKHIRDEIPYNGQDVVYMKPCTYAGSDSYELRSCTVEYILRDSDGTYYCYDGEPLTDISDCLVIMFDKCVVDTNERWLWMTEDGYWEALDKDGE